MKEKKQIKFAVNIMSEENNTWQGQIAGSDVSERYFFRSTLELLKIMQHEIKEKM